MTSSYEMSIGFYPFCSWLISMSYYKWLSKSIALTFTLILSISHKIKLYPHAVAIYSPLSLFPRLISTDIPRGFPLTNKESLSVNKAVNLGPHTPLLMFFSKAYSIKTGSSCL